MKKCVQGILFDFDGTLCDSQKFIYQSFRITLTKHNLYVPLWEEFLELCRGMALVEAYQALTNLENVEHLCKTHRKWQADNFQLVDLFPHVHKTLAKIQSMGIPMVIVTNRGDAVYETLESTNISKFFHTVRHTKNTRDGLQKPHPQMLLDALELVGIDPSSACMVGDMREDMEAGKAAGIHKVVGVSYGFLGHGIAKHDPDHLIHDIRELLEILKIYNEAA